MKFVPNNSGAFETLCFQGKLGVYWAIISSTEVGKKGENLIIETFRRGTEKFCKTAIWNLQAGFLGLFFSCL